MFQQIFRSKSLNRIGLIRQGSQSLSAATSSNSFSPTTNPTTTLTSNQIQLNQKYPISTISTFFGNCLASKKNVFKPELEQKGASSSNSKLSSSEDEDGEDEEKKKSKYRGKTQEFKNKIYLKDESGRMLGLKTKDEANLIATKNRLVLVEDLVSTKKIPTFRLTNPRSLNSMDDNSNNKKKLEIDGDVDESSSSSSEDSDDSSSSSSSSSSEEKSPKQNTRPNVKHFIFTSKLTEHDLKTKINQVKKWIRKGQETVIRVNASKNSRIKLELINTEFDRTFNQKSGCKINQKRITDTELKFNIVPVEQKLIQRMITVDNLANVEGDEEDGGDGIYNVGTIDLDTVDPNKLLSMDQDRLLDEKK